MPCQFCRHSAHVGKCPSCKCKGKPGFWQSLLSVIGTAIGEAKFNS